MASQLDLDQGGTTRQWVNVWLGPSVGWTRMPNNTILPITTGITNLLLGTTLVLVQTAAGFTTTLNLPSALASTAGAQALPGTFLGRPITIVDTAGFASTGNIIINPFGVETIDGLPQVKITSNYGAYVLNPNLGRGGYTLIQ